MGRKTIAKSGGKGPAQPNRSLVGGLECLEYLAGAGRPVGSREAARALGLEPTRANRLLGTLAWMGLAERTADRKYTAGSGLHVLAAMSLRGSRLLSTAAPHLARLGDELPGFSVALGVLWRRQVVYLYFAGPGEDARVAIASRDLFPAEKSSIGQVLLAGMGEGAVRELYADREAGEVERLTGELEGVRREGYALVNERTLGIAVGEPAVAGIALAGVTNEEDRTRLVRRLTECAEKIAREMSV
jgi:DNA-binding IclR family transcriptional regulator